MTRMLRTARRIAIAIAGTAVLGVGIALLVLPGPAFVVIPAGLAILSVEFAWAHRWLQHVRRHGERAIRSFRARREATAQRPD